MIWFVLLICLIVFAVVYLTYEKKYNIISFKGGMDLAELPIITLYQDSKKYNFLLDTGSSCCMINESVLNTLKYQKNDKTFNVTGIEGIKVNECQTCDIKLYYDTKEYDANFIIKNMTDAFASIKNDTGVTLHGILGNDFFEKYKYVIDFKEYIAYCKK